MKILYIVRHEQTQYNADKLFQGSTLDIPLIEKGEDGAEKLVGVFEGIHLDAVVSSPAKRAIDTVRPLADSKGLGIVTNELFLDRNLGQFEGKSYSHIEEEYGNVYVYLFDSRTIIPGSESVDQVHERKQKARDHLLNMDKERIFVASHGPVIAAFCNVMFDKAPHNYDSQYVLGNGEFHYFEVGDKGTLIRAELKLTQVL